MSVRARIHADFMADLRAQLRWLTRNRDRSEIEHLRGAIDEAIDLLSRFPNTGSIERQETSAVLRRLILRRLPYVVWFVRETRRPDADVWLLRLFHARQSRRRVTSVTTVGTPQRRRRIRT